MHRTTQELQELYLALGRLGMVLGQEIVLEWGFGAKDHKGFIPLTRGPSRLGHS